MRIAPIALALLTAGCASSMSGVGGAERYGCLAPEGVQCSSVSGVYANTIRGTPSATARPSMETPPFPARSDSVTPPATRSAPQDTPAASAIRSHPRVLRVWIAPWEDSDGDLNEAAIVHVIVDPGRWLIEHVRPSRRDRIEGVAPPVTTAAEARTPAVSDTTARPERLPPTPGASAPANEPTQGRR